MSGEEDDLEELARELKSDEYPLPEKKDPRPEGKRVSYKNVDVTLTFKKEAKNDAVTEKRILFADSGFDVDKLLYDEGRRILKVPIVLAKEMIYHYDDYDAFRPRAELKAIAPYIKGVPVTRGHPEAKVVTDRSEVLGSAIDAEFEDDELRVLLEISNKELIEDIRSGKLKGVSPGHFSRVDESASGEYEDVHYDVTQRDIFIDHIAIVEEGRCNVADGCGIMIDEAVKEEDKKELEEEGDKEGKMGSKDITSRVDEAISVAGRMETEAEELKKEVEGLAEIEGVPTAVAAKVKNAVGLVDSIGVAAKAKLKESLEKVKELVADEKKGDGKGEGKEQGKDTVADAAMKTLKAERDALRTELDGIVETEKTKLIDELGTLQEVKTKEALKEMSLDALKSDLELVKALRGSKFTVGDEVDGGRGAIRGAYKDVGRKLGGKG